MEKNAHGCNIFKEINCECLVVIIVLKAKRSPFSFPFLQYEIKQQLFFFKFCFISSVAEPFWEEYSDENIKNAEAQRLNAVQLRNVIDGILKKLIADIKQAIEKTSRSFDRRIYESKQAKLKLEDQLRDVNFKCNLLKQNKTKIDFFRFIYLLVKLKKVLKILKKLYVIKNNT